MWGCEWKNPLCLHNISRSLIATITIPVPWPCDFCRAPQLDSNHCNHFLWKVRVQDNQFNWYSWGEKNCIFNRTCPSCSPNSKYKIDLSAEPPLLNDPQLNEARDVGQGPRCRNGGQRRQEHVLRIFVGIELSGSPRKKWKRNGKFKSKKEVNHGD